MKHEDSAATAQKVSSSPTDTAQDAPDKVVARRKGEVLLKHTILKSDHFPGCQNKTLPNQILGAPNFRQVPELPVYGCAIPTVAGLRLVLDALEAGRGQRKVLWHNMREEPVLYINGRPFVVREADKPFQNLEYTGIDCTRVEDMEDRLKADVLREAAEYGNQILIAGETDDFQVVEQWEPVTAEDVQTPRDVYQELTDDGYDVDYLRVPVTDEKAPKADDFAVLIDRAFQPPSGAALVFNCQMGRGRTTTGMVIASLLHLRRLNGTSHADWPSWFAAPGQVLEEQRQRALASPPTPEAELKAGNFGAIRSLLRVLGSGAESKAGLDLVLDACSAMQNLREAISGYRTRLMHEGHEGKRNALLEVCLEYLERYYTLIAFNAYLSGDSFAPNEDGHRTFGQWMMQRPELHSVKERMLRRNPLAAMSLHHPSRHLTQTMPPSTLGLPPATDAQFSEEQQAAVQAKADSLVAARTGAVLGAHTILKEDHFPGCQSEHVPTLFPGAPNLRNVPGFNVYGVGLPTVEGIRATLAHVGAGPGSKTPNGEQVTAVWHNMREEVCIYINGRPYVLREEERPYKNMQEYSGIDWLRLQKMESRLRNDILREARSMGGKLLVARELTHGGHSMSGGEIEDDMEPIAGPAAVQTPQEVYEQLAAEGYRVKYYRVPLTDGTTPKERDFDEFVRHIRAAKPSDPLIFNCQLGGGRTTTGTVIGCLVRGFADAETPRGDQPAIDTATSAATTDVQGPPPVRSTSFKSMDAAAKTTRLTLRNLDPAGSGSLGVLDDAEALAQMASPRSVMSDEVGGASPRASDDEDEVPGGSSDTTSNSAVSAPQPDGKTSVGGTELESAALKEGEYVAVRRFVRLLERGGDAKSLLDETLDRAGVLVNLRTSISRYRNPRRRFRFFRPEIQARHTAFKRGSAYLERYCMLIAFTAYLEDCRRRDLSTSFEDWMSARPDLCQARNSILDNPAGALAPVPAYRAPPALMHRVDSHQAFNQEQREVLSRRQGTVLSRRTILKTSAPRPADVESNALRIPGISDLRHVRGQEVYTLGEATVEGLRRLLSQLGAHAGGPSHAVITDVREEMVVYIAGRPYLRRELEMPAAAFHHAGIRASKLEELEASLAADLAAEAEDWGGRLLLHAEPWAYRPAGRQLSPRKHMSASPSPPQPAALDPQQQQRLQQQLQDLQQAAAAEAVQPAAEQAAAAVAAGGAAAVAKQESAGASTSGRPPRSASGWDALLQKPATQQAAAAGASEKPHTWQSRQAKRRWQLALADAITHNTQQEEAHAEAVLVAFWENAGAIGDARSGICTPHQVFAQLAEEGFQISARRVPLSRERTPEPADLDTLLLQARTPPPGQKSVHLVVSRTATGSSVRFVAALLAGYQRWWQGVQRTTMSRQPSAEPPPSSSFQQPAPLSAADARAFAKHRSAGVMGEYRTIMNLCRVLPDGLDCKLAVDEAIDCCNDIGNLRDDILKCKEAAEARPTAEEDAGLVPAEVAARQLGRHYLQRYFLLIAFRCYLGAHPVPGPDVLSYDQWFAQRAELRFLLSNLNLETAL